MNRISRFSRLIVVLLLLSTLPAFVFSRHDSSYNPGRGYKLLLNEEFCGKSLDTNIWTAHTYGNGLGNNEIEYYQPENVALSNGLLVITAKKELRYDNTGGVPFNYTSGKISTKGKMAFRYGKIAVKVKGPGGPGTWFAVFLLAMDQRTTGWPQCGEMDVVETGLSGQFTNVVAGDMHIAESQHTLWRNSPSFYNAPGFDSSTAFHIYETEWSPEGLKYYVDGNFCGSNARSVDNSDELDNYYFLIINLALMSSATAFGNFQNYDMDAIMPQQALIDWVKIYQKPCEGDAIYNYGAADPITSFAGGNYNIYSELTPAIYKYQYTEGENLQVWTPNIYINNPQVDWIDTYSNLTYGNAYQPDSYEGGRYLEYTISCAGWGWTGQAWYTEFPVDLTAYSNSALVFYVKSDSAISMSAGMIDADNHSLFLPLDASMGYVNDGQWHRITIPVSRYTNTVNLQKITHPFVYITSEPPAGTTYKFGLDDIHYEWNVDQTLIFQDRTENSLVFSYKFSEKKNNMWARLKVNGHLMWNPVKIENAKEINNGDGTYSYLWFSKLGFPKGTKIEAQVIGSGTKTDYFPGDKRTFCAPYTMDINNIQYPYKRWDHRNFKLDFDAIKKCIRK